VILIFSKNNCPACTNTKNMLNTLGIEYTEANIEEDPEAFDRVRSLGYQQVPVVFTPDQSWSGHQPSKLMALKK